VGNQPGKTLVLDGHIDTVPVNEEKWTRTPTVAISKMAKCMAVAQRT
jgi:acetylornithine deacetylase/succinyl-diaminopimelate desuccinylase-like protein